MDEVAKQVENVTPKISIGMVVYNGAAHIRHALDSIVRQSYSNIELIVVDGGSSDGTLEILREYKKYISVLVSEPDKGIYDAMNKVCTLASGDWLIFFGCDDVLLDSLSNVHKHLSDSSAVYYGDVIFRSSGAYYGGVFSKFRWMEQNICHQGLFYPKVIYQQYSYSLNYKWLADYVYNLMLLKLGIQFIYTDVVVSIYNDKGGSSLGDDDFKRDQTELMSDTFGSIYVMARLVRKYVISKKLLFQHQVRKVYWLLFSNKKG